MLIGYAGDFLKVSANIQKNNQKIKRMVIKHVI